jgi:hypothetical protein
LVFLALSYVVVGVAGEIACAEETLEANGALVLAGTVDNHNEGSKKASPIVEHCYTCVPLLLPASVLIVLPSDDPIEVSFRTPTFRLEDHPGLDTPPPKSLT